MLPLLANNIESNSSKILVVPASTTNFHVQEMEGRLVVDGMASFAVRLRPVMDCSQVCR